MSIEGQGHFFTIYFPGFVCFVLYLAKISGERLQDHWSSGLAHLSRRLTGELIGYPWRWRPSVRPFTFSNIFSSETAWPIKAKFYAEPPLEGVKTKVYINGPGHMTKMAAMPIYGKNLKKSSPEPEVLCS